MIKKIVILVCATWLVGTGTASAQMLQWEDRGFVNVNFGGQGASKNIDTNFAIPLYGETATVDVNQKHGGSAFFDLSGGYRVWNNLAAGLSFTKRSADTDGTYGGNVPDPISYVFRSVSGTVNDLRRSETWIAIPVTYVIPVTDKIDVMVFAGPAHASLTQELVSGVTVEEGSTAPVVNVARETVDKGFWGYLIGADVRYLITRQLGVGGFLRVQSANGDLTSTVRADVGGFQAGGGLRVRF